MVGVISRYGLIAARTAEESICIRNSLGSSSSRLFVEAENLGSCGLISSNLVGFMSNSMKREGEEIQSLSKGSRIRLKYRKCLHNKYNMITVSVLDCRQRTFIGLLINVDFS